MQISFIYFDASTGAPTSLTVDVQYSMAETLRRAVMNTIMGIAIVFIVLIFLSFLIYLFRFIPNPEAKKKAQAAAALHLLRWQHQWKQQKQTIQN